MLCFYTYCMDAARHVKVSYHLSSILTSRVPLCFDLSYYSGSIVGALGAPFMDLAHVVGLTLQPEEAPLARGNGKETQRHLFH